MVRIPKAFFWYSAKFLERGTIASSCFSPSPGLLHFLRASLGSSWANSNITGSHVLRVHRIYINMHFSLASQTWLEAFEAYRKVVYTGIMHGTLNVISIIVHRHILCPPLWSFPASSSIFSPFFSFWLFFSILSSLCIRCSLCTSSILSHLSDSDSSHDCREMFFVGFDSLHSGSISPQSHTKCCIRLFWCCGLGCQEKPVHMQDPRVQELTSDTILNQQSADGCYSLSVFKRTILRGILNVSQNFLEWLTCCCYSSDGLNNTPPFLLPVSVIDFLFLLTAIIFHINYLIKIFEALLSEGHG